MKKGQLRTRRRLVYGSLFYLGASLPSCSYIDRTFNSAALFTALLLVGVYPALVVAFFAPAEVRALATLSRRKAKRRYPALFSGFATVQSGGDAFAERLATGASRVVSPFADAVGAWLKGIGAVAAMLGALAITIFVILGIMGLLVIGVRALF